VVLEVPAAPVIGDEGVEELVDPTVAPVALVLPLVGEPLGLPVTPADEPVAPALGVLVPGADVEGVPTPLFDGVPTPLVAGVPTPLVESVPMPGVPSLVLPVGPLPVALVPASMRPTISTR
jgi:hypothetical protein